MKTIPKRVLFQLGNVAGAKSAVQNGNGRFYRLQAIVDRLSADEISRLCIHECSDEHTGKRYGQAACRFGRCEKIGGGGRNAGSEYAYQIWAVWA